MASQKTWNYIIFGVGIFLFVVGIVMGIMWPQVNDYIIQQLMQFSPSSETYAMWMDQPIPIYMTFYLFNITNWKDFLEDNTIKLNFEEVGPFVFEEVHTRQDIHWDDENYLVTFNQTRTWTFVPLASKPLSTEITNVNAVAMTMGVYARSWDSPLWQQLVNALINKYEDYFVTATAREWIFDGYEDGILNLLNPLRKITDIPIPFEKFGWLYGRNGSAAYDGVFTMKTGVDDLANLGMMELWNYKNSTPYYEGQCGKIHGSTGEVIPPMKELQNYTSVFTSDFCSSVTLKYSSNTTVEGVSAYEFTADENTLDNGDVNPDNSCYCVDECTPVGARNISACRWGAPAFGSFPHFYNADPSYTENITGLNATEEKHRFIFRFQPDVGIPLEVRARIQVNILMQPLSIIDMVRESPRFYAPMMWFEQKAKITSDLATLINLLLVLTEIGMGVFYGIAGIGFLMVFIRFMVIILRHKKKSTLELFS